MPSQQYAAIKRSLFEMRSQVSPTRSHPRKAAAGWQKSAGLAKAMRSEEECDPGNVSRLKSSLEVGDYTLRSVSRIERSCTFSLIHLGRWSIDFQGAFSATHTVSYLLYCEKSFSQDEINVYIYSLSICLVYYKSTGTVVL